MTVFFIKQIAPILSFLATTQIWTVSEEAHNRLPLLLRLLERIVGLTGIRKGRRNALQDN